MGQVRKNCIGYDAFCSERQSKRSGRVSETKTSVNTFFAKAYWLILCLTVYHEVPCNQFKHLEEAAVC
jgi:hypothetical protein